MTHDTHSRHHLHLTPAVSPPLPDSPAGLPALPQARPGALSPLDGAVGMVKCVIADAHGELSAAEFVEFAERVRRFLRVQAAA